MYGKHFSLYIILVIVFFLIIFMISCSTGQINETATETIDDRQPLKTEEQVTGESEATEDPVISTEKTESENPAGTEVEPVKDSDVYTDKNIKIEGTNTIYEDIFTGSISLEIERDSADIGGYIFLSYMEVKMQQGKSYPCENVIKGLLEGTLDKNTGKIDGEIKGEIAAEGRNCFSGPVVLELSGNTVEDGRFIEGGFTLPSGNRLYFLLEKIEGQG